RRKLQRIIQELETQRKKQKVKEKSYFGKLQKKLPWPIMGKVVSKYGRKKHPKYHTSTKNNGIDIKAPYNTPVAAVSYGEVAYADKFLGYGNVILIDHYGGYYTLYAHLSTMDVQVKDKVYQGEVIGRVGDTGSLKGSILHFEIRVNGKTVNPLNWLVNK
ncbi:peptidase M23, partial [candidate division TA06 bacterium]